MRNLLIGLVLLATLTTATQEAEEWANGSGVVDIREEYTGLSTPVDRWEFPSLKDDSYKPPKQTVSIATHYDPSLKVEEDVDLGLDDDDEDDDDAVDYDNQQTMRLVELLGGQDEVNKHRKVKRQLKAVAKQWGDALRLRDRYEAVLTDAIPMFPTTIVVTNNTKPTLTAKKTAEGSEAEAAEEETEEEEDLTITTTVHSPWWTDVVPSSIYRTEIPKLIDWPKQMKFNDAVKNGAKQARILKAELQQEQLQGSNEEKPGLGLLVQATGGLIPFFGTTLRELEEHKKFQINTMRALAPVLEEAEKQLQHQRDVAENAKKAGAGATVHKKTRKNGREMLATTLEFDRELKKLKSLGKYCTTRVKRSVGADLDTLQEMLYLHYSIRGKAGALHGDSGFADFISGAVDKTVPEEQASPVFPVTSLSSVVYNPTLPWYSTKDIATLQGLAVMLAVLIVASFTLPWVLWILGFAVVLCINMWRTNPKKEKGKNDFPEGGRKLGGSGSTNEPPKAGADKPAAGGASLTMIPYRAWQLTTAPWFQIGLQAVLLYLVLTQDKKYFIPYYIKGPGLSLATTAFNLKHFFSPGTALLIVTTVLGLAWTCVQVLFTLGRTSSKRATNGRRKH